MEYYLYMVLCDGESIYTGTAKDPLRRIGEHISHDPKCAKYTRSRTVVSPLAVWRCESRSAACKYEYAVKQLQRADKVRLAEAPDALGVLFCKDVSEATPVPCPVPSKEECLARLNPEKIKNPIDKSFDACYTLPR